MRKSKEKKNIAGVINNISTDMRKEFGEKKCSYLIVEHGKLDSIQPLYINGDYFTYSVHKLYYKYIDIDENISYGSTVKIVSREYYNREK